MSPPSTNGQPAVDTGAIRCLCTFTEDDGDTIFCDQCGFWQHMSCVGLANTSADALPDQWFCWNCKPDKFEWVRSLNGTSGDTLATSLGITQSHWNPAYVQSQSQPLTLDPSSARPASSTLRISNLLSPAPSPSPSYPPPSAPKILLDPLKAKRLQEQRFIKNDRLRKHMEASGQPMPSTHGRKGSVAGGRAKPRPTGPSLTTQIPPQPLSTPTNEAGPSTPNPVKRKTSASATSSKKPRVVIPDPTGTIQLDPRSRTRSRSPSGDVEMLEGPPRPRVFSNGVPLAAPIPFPEGADYFVPTKNPLPLPPYPRTPIAGPYLHSNPQTPGPPPPASPPPVPRPPHPLTTGLGAGAPIGVPRGSGTGSGISRPPRPLGLRAFPTTNPGLAVFLDPSSSVGGPTPGETNAVVRPLVCHTGEGLGFAVFALKEFKEGDPIVLGWEVLDRGSIESAPPPTSPKSTLTYVGDTFLTCGHCGRPTTECVPDAMEKLTLLPNGTGNPHKRQRSSTPITIDEASPTRPAKRARLVSSPIYPKATPVDQPKASEEVPPEVGVDVSLLPHDRKPGDPIIPGPKARFRATYKVACKVDPPPSLPVLLPTPPNSSNSNSTSKPIPTPISTDASHRSTSSSPLTEVSEEDGDAESTPKLKPKANRLAALKVKSFRIESTPPPEEEEIVKEVKVLEMKTDKGPPKFRKWGPPEPVPEPVVEKEVEKDKDVDVEMQPQPTPTPQPPTPNPPSRPSTSGGMASFSINNLLNPAPERRSRLRLDGILNDGPPPARYTPTPAPVPVLPPAPVIVREPSPVIVVREPSPVVEPPVIEEKPVVHEEHMEDVPVEHPPMMEEPAPIEDVHQPEVESSIPEHQPFESIVQKQEAVDTELPEPHVEQEMTPVEETMPESVDDQSDEESMDIGGQHVPETKQVDEVVAAMDVDDEAPLVIEAPPGGEPPIEEPPVEEPPTEAPPPPEDASQVITSPLVVVVPSPSSPLPIPERSPSHHPPSPTTSSLAVENHAHASPDPASPSSSNPIRKTSFADYLKRRKADTAMLKALQHEKDRGEGSVDSGGALSLILGDRGRERLRESLPPSDSRRNSIVGNTEHVEATPPVTEHAPAPTAPDAPGLVVHKLEPAPSMTPEPSQPEPKVDYSEPEHRFSPSVERQTPAPQPLDPAFGSYGMGPSLGDLLDGPPAMELPMEPTRASSVSSPRELDHEMPMPNGVTSPQALSAPRERTPTRLEKTLSFSEHRSPPTSPESVKRLGHSGTPNGIRVDSHALESPRLNSAVPGEDGSQPSSRLGSPSPQTPGSASGGVHMSGPRAGSPVGLAIISVTDSPTSPRRPPHSEFKDLSIDSNVDNIRMEINAVGPPPSLPRGPGFFPGKKPPTGPRSERAAPAAVPLPGGEEGEIMSSPSGSPGPSPNPAVSANSPVPSSRGRFWNGGSTPRTPNIPTSPAHSSGRGSLAERLSGVTGSPLEPPNGPKAYRESFGSSRGEFGGRGRGPRGRGDWDRTRDWDRRPWNGPPGAPRDDRNPRRREEDLAREREMERSRVNGRGWGAPPRRGR